VLSCLLFLLVSFVVVCCVISSSVVLCVVLVFHPVSSIAIKVMRFKDAEGHFVVQKVFLALFGRI
jgi:hypothetical protein